MKKKKPKKTKSKRSIKNWWDNSGIKFGIEIWRGINKLFK